MAKPKIVLPQKLHKEFHKLNSDANIAGLAAFFDDNNIDINATLYKPEEGKYSYTLFHHIFNNKNKDIMVKLDFFHSRGVDINLRNGLFAHTALFELYASERDLPVLEKLLALGIDVNIPDIEGTTYITRLTENYGDKFVYDYDNAHRHVDKKESEFEIGFRFIELVLQHGADPSIKNKYDTSALDWLEHRKSSHDFEAADAKLEKLFSSNNNQ
jgi:ankyrin repeat protein